MNSAFFAKRGAARRSTATATPPVSTRRQLSLAEIVRDLAGWTPPARPIPPRRPLLNWPLI